MAAPLRAIDVRMEVVLKIVVREPAAGIPVCARAGVAQVPAVTGRQREHGQIIAFLEAHVWLTAPLLARMLVETAIAQWALTAFSARVHAERAHVEHRGLHLRRGGGNHQWLARSRWCTRRAHEGLAQGARKLERWRVGLWRLCCISPLGHQA